MSINYDELYKKNGDNDDRNALRVAVENLYEMAKSNNERINNLVNRYHELYNDLSQFKRHALNKEEKDK